MAAFPAEICPLVEGLSGLSRYPGAVGAQGHEPQSVLMPGTLSFPPSRLLVAGRHSGCGVVLE